MATTIEALIELQEVDGRIRELEAEEKDLPRRKAMEKARLTGVAADLEAAKAALKYAEDKVKGYKDEGADLEEKIRQYKIAQAGSKTTNREYLQWSMQIENVEQSLEAAKNNALAAEDQLPAAQQRLKDAQTKYDAEQEGVDSFCGEIDARMEAVAQELEECRRERVEKAAAVDDPQFKLYYERIKMKRWPAVVPLTHESVCDGCHLVQPPSVGQLVNANARNGREGRQQRIVACTMCGRMLYGDF